MCADARLMGCDVIVQCGDFGFWAHTPKGSAFLDAASAALAATEMRCVWVDGNHENHEVLRNVYMENGTQDDEGFWIIRPRLAYAARAHRWEWDGLRYLALGGAFSIDKEWRHPMVSWWPLETISMAEAELAASGGKADVMVTHDCPWGVDGIIGSGTAGNKDFFPESQANRKVLLSVVEEVRPSLLVHGHYHHRNSALLRLRDGWEVQVEGLNCDDRPHAFWVKELAA